MKTTQLKMLLMALVLCLSQGAFAIGNMTRSTQMNRESAKPASVCPYKAMGNKTLLTSNGPALMPTGVYLQKAKASTGVRRTASASKNRAS